MFAEVLKRGDIVVASVEVGLVAAGCLCVAWIDSSSSARFAEELRAIV